MTASSSGAWKYVAVVVFVTGLGFLFGNWRANELCTGGDCGILVLEVIYWTAGAFIVSVLTVAVAALLARSRRRNEPSQRQ